MSGDVANFKREAAQADPVDDPQPPRIGERLRSTMADEHAAPYLAEINRLKAELDDAIKARRAAERVASSMAERVATEHRRRCEVERQLDENRQLGTERERMERMMEAAVALRPARPPGAGERLHRAWRRVWHAITGL